jgi:hypothetical protein
MCAVAAEVLLSAVVSGQCLEGKPLVCLSSSHSSITNHLVRRHWAAGGDRVVVRSRVEREHSGVAAEQQCPLLEGPL